MANLQLPFGIEVLNQKPEIAKYFLSGETPYNNIAEVNANLVTGVRHTGLTVNILGAEYWYKEGVTDPDLVLKGISDIPITGATNGLSINSDKLVVLGGTLTGNTTINTNSFGVAIGTNAIASGNSSHAEGCSTQAIGNTSHAEGKFTIASGSFTHAEGFCTISLCNSSHAEGENTIASGKTSHAEGLRTCAVGAYSHSEGDTTRACEYASHAEGSYTTTLGFGSHSGGYGHVTKHIIAGGSSSFNHSKNTTGQITNHGANANYSTILGGLNHNIESGNTGAAIIGGNAIKLTGTSYIDTTAVAKLALITTPINNTVSDQVLVRNTSTGLVDYVSKSLLTSTVANGLSIDGSNIVLGGTLTGDTNIETNGYGVSIGNNTTAIGTNSFATGKNASATGNCVTALGGAIVKGYHSIGIGHRTYVGDNSGYYNIGLGYLSCICGGHDNIAIGAWACSTNLSGSCNTTIGNWSKVLESGNYSTSIGVQAKSDNIYSTAIGAWTRAYGICSTTMGAWSCALGTNSTAVGAWAVATGGSSIAMGKFSKASMDNSVAIGTNNKILANSSRVVLIGGTGRTFTATGLTDYVVASNLAIESTPDIGGLTDGVLVWNSTDKKIKSIQQSGVTTSVRNGLSVDSENYVVLGGTLTGNTTVDTAGFGVAFGTTGAFLTNATGANSFAGGCNTSASGNTSFAWGYNARGTGNNSVALGLNAYSIGNCSLTLGCGSTTYSEWSLALSGAHVLAGGVQSIAIGSNARTSGCRAIALGMGNGGGPRYLLASGEDSINVSHNGNFTQTVGHGALAYNSSIFGGRDHNVAITSTGATIIGGDGIKVSGSEYVWNTIVGDLAIWNTPITGTTVDTVLVWNSTDKKIKSIQQSGVTTSVRNGLSVDSENYVVLGGVLTGNTNIETAGYGVAIGTNAIASGNSSHAEGCETKAIGDGSHAEGCKTQAIGYDSHAEGRWSCAVGNRSHAEGDFSCAVGFSSHAEGKGSCAIGCFSHAEGNGTHAVGLISHAEGFRTRSIGNYSHAGGFGCISTDNFLFACGRTSFNHSENTIGQTTGHGANANNSAILGGINHNIASGNTGAAILGGNAIKLTGTDYIDTTAVSNLAIMTSPTTGSSNQILARNLSTGLIEVTTAVVSNNLYAITGVSTNVTLTSNEYVVVGETSGGTITITMPASPATGQAYKIKDHGDGLTNNITIAGNGNNIDGDTNALINTDYGALEVVFDGTEWFTLGFIG